MSARTHTAIALVSPRTIDTVQVPTPTPGAGEVLVKVRFAAYSAFDGHQVEENLHVHEYPQVLGVAASGIIVVIGQGVSGLQAGDEVALASPPGNVRAMQEYIISYEHRVSKLPSGIALKDAAAINDNFVTAWFTLRNHLGLNLPDSIPRTVRLDDETASTPILIWGGGTSVAFYALQILKYAGYTNVITTASARNAQQALTLGATQVVHYDDKDVVAKVVRAAGGRPIKHIFNVISSSDSINRLAEIVEEAGSKVALLLPIKIGIQGLHDEGAQLLSNLPAEKNPFHKGVQPVLVIENFFEKDPLLKNNLTQKFIPALLASGDVKPQPSRIFNQGTLAQRARSAAEASKQGNLGGARPVVDLTIGEEQL